MPPAQAEALELHESTAHALQEGLADDGTVLVHIIRPCVGRGKGRHLYEADMLRANAEKFKGWPMFEDHLSPAARKALAGLPRKFSDTGGVVIESWWDENVAAEPDKGFGQGAIVGRAKPVGFAKTLCEEAPEIVGTSISAQATGVKEVTRNGQRVLLVEGIEDKGSVDWVTEAGAGGRVVSLVESAYPSETEENTLLESLTDEELRDYLAENREGLLEALATAGAEENGNGSTNDGGKMPEQQEITADALQEALVREGIIEQLNEAIDTVVENRVNEHLTGRVDEVIKERLDTQVRPLVESAVEDERELIHEEARANASRAVKLRDMRDEAHDQIEEARLPESWKAAVKERFNLTEAGPTRDLDQVDDIDPETGDVTKPASEVLREAVETDIKRQRELLAAAQPTRVRGQGPTHASENGDGEPEKNDKPAEGTLYGAVLQEAGIDPNTAYEGR